jgi:hypothetical protein
VLVELYLEKIGSFKIRIDLFRSRDLNHSLDHYSSVYIKVTKLILELPGYITISLGRR